MNIVNNSPCHPVLQKCWCMSARNAIFATGIGLPRSDFAMYRIDCTALTHIEGASTSLDITLETVTIQSLRSRMLTSTSPFLLMYLLVVSMSLSFVWSSFRVHDFYFNVEHCSCRKAGLSASCWSMWCHVSRFYAICVVVGWSMAGFLINSLLMWTSSR